MSLCQRWAWQPPQTASHIHIRHIQRVWAHWYTVHRHAVSALHRYPPYLAPILGLLGHLHNQNDVIMSWLRPTATSNCFPHPYYALICCPLAHGRSLTQLYPPTWLRFWGCWVTCWVKMKWLCQGWGCWPPQTASHIHINHIQSVWTYWYFVHRHMVEVLHSYTHPTWLRFWGSGSLKESKWCDLIMVEANIHLKIPY
jgi:hypothetical protein